MNISNQLLTKWFDELDSLNIDSDENLKEFSIEIYNNENLINSIYIAIEDSNYHDLYLESICKRLFKLFLTKNETLKNFVFFFLPALIGTNLINSLDFNLKLKHNSTDILLIEIFNLSVINLDGTIKKKSFKIPSFNKPSIYHNCINSFNLNETTNKKFDSLKERKITYVLDFIDKNQLNACNRMNTVCYLLQIYHDQLSILPKHSLYSFCRVCKSLLLFNRSCIDYLNFANIKFDISTSINYADILQKCLPKLQFNSNFLVQLLNILYFCIYNGLIKESNASLIEIHNRALNNLYTDVLLMTNAIFNSLSISPEDLEEKYMKLNLNLYPNFNNLTLNNQSKTAITNASFKTQKLPEDIPIILNDKHGAIPEESEENVIINDKNSNPQVQPIKSIKQNETLNNANKNNLIRDVRKERKKDKNKNKIKFQHGDNLENYSLTTSNNKSQNFLNMNNELNYESIKLINTQKDIKNNKNSQNNVSTSTNEEVIPLV